jgi:O-antigen/teichoic acid export membrane protein/transposase
MNPVTLAASFWSRTTGAVRSLFSDALYRGSLTLIANTVATSAIGFVFWSLAAHRYPASAVGVFSSVTAGASLLAAIAALGLPNVIIRHIASVQNARELMIVAVTAIATVGTVLCLVIVLVLGPHLPASLDLQQRGERVLLVTALVTLTAVNSILEVGLIATRSSHDVLIKNLVGSIARVVAMLLLVSLAASGLLIAYGLGLGLTMVLGGVMLDRQIGAKRTRFGSFRVLRNYLSITSGNYVATIMGILPVSIVPLEILVVLGAAETGRFAVAFLIGGFLNVIPATVAQVLFAEASREGAPQRGQLRKAIRGVYGLLLPAIVIVIAAAPFMLRLFGAGYAMAATGCLRVLALSALFTGGTYLVDSLLIARDRIAAYIFMNGANAALVLAFVGILARRGLTAAAVGWALAQGLSLLLGGLVLATGRLGWRRQAAAAPAAEAAQSPDHDRSSRSVTSSDPQVRELLATWPMMPTTLIAEQIGWDQPGRVLLDRVTELRMEYLEQAPHVSVPGHPPGEIAQCGFWFPPLEVPVGFGQTRSAFQLPVLTMISGYSHWLSAMLIPSRKTEDLFPGWWELLEQLGSVPRTLTWDSEVAVGRWQDGKEKITPECTEFCRSLGTRVTIGRPADPETRGLIERSYDKMERYFLPGRTFISPVDFNAQLHDWLGITNARRQAPGYSPAERIDADRQAMLPLPLVPPVTGWRVSMRAGPRPLVRFDSNYYSIDPALTGREIELTADLNQVRVLCEGELAAEHERIWAWGQTK